MITNYLRGAPKLWNHDWKYTTLLYEGLCGDGKVLPAVIFTSCPKVPTTATDGFDAKVFYIPGLKAPSAELTLRWLDAVSDYLEDDPVILHDHGPEYKNELMKQEWKDRNIGAFMFPATAGALVNPCDNAFNAQLRAIFNKQIKRTYEEKLRAILTAYYTPSEKSIVGYFEKSGLLRHTISKNFVRDMMHEGWRPGTTHHEIYDKCRAIYEAWEHDLRLAATGKSLPTHEDQHRTKWHVWKHNQSK